MKISSVPMKVNGNCPYHAVSYIKRYVRKNLMKILNIQTFAFYIIRSCFSIKATNFSSYNERIEYMSKEETCIDYFMKILEEGKFIHLLPKRCIF